MFSGVCATAFRATQTEAALASRSLSLATLDLALCALDADLLGAGVEGGGGWKGAVARALLYKFFLVGQGAGLSPSLRSAIEMVERPVSKASETFPLDPSVAPIGQPIPKIDGLLQATGQAVYTADEPLPAGTLHGAYAYSQRALAVVRKLDSSDALQMPGVVAILSASDVQGQNDITSGVGDEFLLVPEGGIVQCVGQPLLLILAESVEEARAAAWAVKVEYAPVLDEEGREVLPILSCEEAIVRKSFLPAGMVKELSCGEDIKEALAKAKHRKSGRLSLGGQKHFYFETQTSLCVPQEGGTFTIYTSTQAPSDTHTVVAKVRPLLPSLPPSLPPSGPRPAQAPSFYSSSAGRRRVRRQAHAQLARTHSHPLPPSLPPIGPRPAQAPSLHSSSAGRRRVRWQAHAQQARTHSHPLPPFLPPSLIKGPRPAQAPSLHSSSAGRRRVRWQADAQHPERSSSGGGHAEDRKGS